MRPSVDNVEPELQELLRRGAQAHAQGHAVEALSAFRAGMQRYPHEWRFPSNAATVLHGERRFGEALKLLNAALRLAPEEPAMLNKLAGWLLELGQPEASIRLLEQAVQRSVGDALSLLHLGSAYLQTKQDERAAATAERACALHPELADAHLLTAFVEQSRGQRDASDAAFQRAIELDPFCGQAYFHLARGGSYRNAEALEALLRRPDLPPESRFRIRFALGCIYDRAGAHEAAWAHFDGANRGAGRCWDPDRARRVAGEIAGVCHRRMFEEQSAAAPRPGLAPIFVVGMPRTGSSLLEQILAGHPGVHAVGEHGDGIPRIAKQLPNVRDGVRAFPAGIADLTADDRAALARRYAASLPGDPASGLRPVDKLLANFQALGLIAQLFPDARVLDCRRDPRDCGLSAYFLEFQRNELSWSYDLESIARYYEDYDALMTHWSEHLPLPIHEVHYEDLVRHPEETARRALAFCGLDWEPSCLEFPAMQRAVYTASAMQVREQLHTRAVARWKPYERFLGPLGRLSGRDIVAER
ncbi:MAG: sulfotransferase [Planctomycetota bacterium]